MHATKQQMKLLGRLKGRSDFLRVQQGGRKWVSKSLILQVAPCPHDAPIAAQQCRVGFTVSKRVSKSAVVRNRVKRRLRALAYDVLPLCAAQSHDYVLIGRPETGPRTYKQLQDDLKWCLKKLDML